MNYELIAAITLYILLLWVIGHITSRKATNSTFFKAENRAPWYMVSFGMIGTSVSGVSFVSVPGMVISSDMSYMQTVLGFIPGYFIVAFLLLPIYYKLKLTTIYTYLKHRLGQRSYLTGAWFFLLSDMTGAAVKFYVVCIILQQFVFSHIGLPFFLTVPLLIIVIWLYTRKGGISTLVWTDSVQTLCMIAALVLIIYNVCGAMDMSLPDAIKAVAADEHSRVFVFDDIKSPRNFWKQFISGAFIVVVMTGLNQNMMQKNLTCKSLGDAKKDMCSYAFAFVPVNLLFLCLGVMLVLLAGKQGIALPDKGDELLVSFISNGALGSYAVIFFVLGIIAASFSTVDSALTALTTSFVVDIKGRPDDEKLRHRAHKGISLVFVLFILAFHYINSTSVIDAVYILCSYTYGPLLGLFSYGLLTRREVRDKLVPYICVASPVLCFLLDTSCQHFFGYKFGYELLLLNGLLTFIGLLLTDIVKVKR